VTRALATILFTDIEGSTRLAQRLGAQWRAVVAEHYGLIGDAIDAHGGRVAAIRGDSFFALFDLPGDALAAASAAQRAIAAHAWPLPVRVRMGVHTGTVERGEHDWVGLDIHLAARVQDAAHGEQVLVTEATRALARGFAFADVGEHRLKDFPTPEPLWQLVYDGRGPAAFPPLRTQPVRPTNLPADPRRLVGRETELNALRAMLTGDAQLVTIVGMGGTGKTRLAVAAAESLLSEFPGGAWLVPLAGIRDEVGLIHALATALEVPDRDADGVVRRLCARPALLVLDNFEHLVDAAPLVAGHLDAAPCTRVLVTSQLPLRVANERLLRLDPLPPQDAVTLFGERARAVSPGFELEVHRASVEAICERLEGLPLSVELAAAHVPSLAPPDLLRRLDRSLGVLVRGARDVPERHRTLRDALEWTYTLLATRERMLLAQLGAFAGPASLDAIEAVAGDDALDALAGLIDASLARRIESREHGVRYTLPQAVRDFAAERLAASCAEHATRCAHAEHLVRLAAAASYFLPGSDDAARAPLLALQAEQRPALDWTRVHARELHARLAAALGFPLTLTGRTREAYAELCMAIDGGAHGWAEIACDSAALTLELPHGHRIESGVAAIRAGGDALELQLALQAAGIYFSTAGQPQRAVECSAEGLALARRAGDPGRKAVELLLTAQALVQARRLDEAQGHLDEAEPLMTCVRDSRLSLRLFVADLAVERGDWTLAARGAAEHALIAARHSTSQLILDLRVIALALGQLGDHDAALELAAAATATAAVTGETGGNPWAVALAEVLGEARAAAGRERTAAAERRGHALLPRAAAVRAAELVEGFAAPVASPAPR
jgi:predicted ATPase/class 3 adenylate cyclase